MAQSRCMFCNSSAYGKGCPYSPHRYHVHISNSKKCIYCGSSAMGCCCPYNPNGKVHIHGVDFNQMIKDSVSNTITNIYLIEQFQRPVTQMPAYKLGLINEKGKRIKKSETIEERNALTVLDQYILNVRNLLGEKINLLPSILFLETDTCLDVSDELTLEEYTDCLDKEISLGKRLQNIINDLKSTIIEANESGLPSTLIEKIIIEKINED